MRRSTVLVPCVACLVFGAFGCFSGSSGVDSPNRPDAQGASGNDAGGFDATSGESGAIEDDASTIDAQGGLDAPTSIDAPEEAAVEDASVTDGATEAAPPIDAGAGCIPPVSASALSPVAEGLPANGLALWLRADRGLYLTAAKRVCAWADQSGNGNILSNPGPALPLLVGPGGDADGGFVAGPDGGVSGGVGGQPGVFFDGANCSLGMGGVLGIPSTGARTFIAVVRMVTPAGRFHSVAQGESGSPGTYVMFDANTWQSAGNREGVYVTNNSYDTALATSTASRVHVLTIAGLPLGDPVTSNIDYRVNGATQSFTLKAGSGSLASFSTANFTSVGSVDTTNSVGSGGTAVVAEVLIYSRALDVGERASVEAALMARYAIP